MSEENFIPYSEIVKQLNAKHDTMPSAIECFPGSSWSVVYQIELNADSLFNPCSKCGSLFYRGPFHIVKNYEQIICQECLKEEYTPLSAVLDFYYSDFKVINTSRSIADGKGIVKTLVGYKGVETLSTDVHLAIEELTDCLLQSEHSLIYALRAGNTFKLYAYWGGMVCAEKESVLYDYFNLNERAFAHIQYFLVSKMYYTSPIMLPVLRTHDEWLAQ